MSEDRTDHGCQWVKETYGEELKCFEDKQYENSMSTSKNDNADIDRDVEEHVKSEFQKKRETTNLWFENSKRKSNFRKNHVVVKTN